VRKTFVLVGLSLLLGGCGAGGDTATPSLSPPGAPARTLDEGTVSARTEEEAEASADASSTLTLRAGWNPVGLECEEVTSLTPGPGVVGMALWDGQQYQVGNLDLDDLNADEGGRRGFYIYCTRATTLTYRGRGGGAGITLRGGWNLISFTTRTEVSCGNITGEGIDLIHELLPTLYECRPDNRVDGVHYRTGRIRPGRPYWVWCRRPIRIKCPNGTPPAPSPRPRPSPKASPAPSVKPSPVASPLASPVASPVASPLASPVASPVASPLASPSPVPAASPSPQASPSPIPAASPSPAAEPSPSPKGNNGGGNGTDPQPPGDPPIND